jgi:hypothetical protein
MKLEKTASRVNVVNVGERYKSVTFTTHPHESKGPVNVVNVVRGILVCRARGMPKDVSTGERRILGTLLDNPNMLCPWLPQDVGIALGYPKKSLGLAGDIPVGIYHKILGFAGDLVA